MPCLEFLKKSYFKFGSWTNGLQKAEKVKEISDFKSKSKKGLGIHMVKIHSVGSIECNYKVLVYHGGGLREDNQI